MSDTQEAYRELVGVVNAVRDITVAALGLATDVTSLLAVWDQLSPGAQRPPSALADAIQRLRDAHTTMSRVIEQNQ